MTRSQPQYFVYLVISILVFGLRWEVRVGWHKPEVPLPWEDINLLVKNWGMLSTGLGKMIYVVLSLNHIFNWRLYGFIWPLYWLCFRFEDSALFETPPLGRTGMQSRTRQPSKKREAMDPFEGLEKYGVNLGNENDENAASKKRKR